MRSLLVLLVFLFRFSFSLDCYDYLSTPDQISRSEPRIVKCGGCYRQVYIEEKNSGKNFQRIEDYDLIVWGSCQDENRNCLGVRKMCCTEYLCNSIPNDPIIDQTFIDEYLPTTMTTTTMSTTTTTTNQTTSMNTSFVPENQPPPYNYGGESNRFRGSAFVSRCSAALFIIFLYDMI